MTKLDKLMKQETDLLLKLNKVRKKMQTICKHPHSGTVRGQTICTVCGKTLLEETNGH